MESMLFIIIILFAIAGIANTLLGYLLGFMVYAESKITKVIGKILGLIYSVLLLHTLTMVIWEGVEFLVNRLSEMEFGYSYIVTLLVDIVGYTILIVGWLVPPILGFYLGGKRKKRRITSKVLPTSTKNLLILVCASTIFTSGCELKDNGHNLWIQTRDLNIGTKIDNWLDMPHEIIKTNGLTHYTFKEKSGCSWAFIVDQNNTILAWQYISDPSLCKQTTKLGPF